ncbi:ESCRT II complex subunit Dot2 [Tilletia horrida]|nr:ESCRT II complex subunit Dot2 [Tilletia horrida]
MRRGGGLAALERHSTTTSSFADLSSDLSAAQLTELRNQLSTFSSALRSFATTHRAQILRDPEFRHAFQKMCASLGVDPLSGGGGGGPAGSGSSSSSSPLSKRGSSIWADILPGLSDFQYDLGVQIIDVCVSTRALNGGMISMDELILRIQALRSGSSAPSTLSSSTAASVITPEDIARSIQLLEPLGSGYAIINVPSIGPSSASLTSSSNTFGKRGAGSHPPNIRQMVRSVPREMDMDAQTVLGLLLQASSSAGTGGGYITLDIVVQPNMAMGKTAWTQDRASAVLDGMLMGEGTLWVDNQVFPARYYSLAASTSMF